MQFDWRKAQLFSYLCVLDFPSFTNLLQCKNNYDIWQYIVQGETNVNHYIVISAHYEPFCP
jgi:hypothetical protein